MIIKLNKQLKFYGTMRLHGEKTTVQRVLDLHREGWCPDNIASIAKVNVSRVKQILKDKGILM
jgi:uncharacterized protein (DUF433 family)